MLFNNAISLKETKQCESLFRLKKISFQKGIPFLSNDNAMFLFFFSLYHSPYATITTTKNIC